MTEKSELAVIDLDKIDVNKLPELANFKERGQKLVKECKFVEIKDNSTYETAKKNRTALRTFRTDVEKSDKAIKSKLNNFKNRVGEVSASLIAITEPAEKTQQEEVERYEQIKENERLEKLRLEQERVDNIKKKIGEFRQYWEDKFSMLTFETIESLKTNFKAVLNQHNRSIYQEFEVLFDDSASYLQNLLEAKIKTLTDQEEIRLKQIRLAEELEKQRIEAERIAEEQRKEREKLEAEQKAEAEKIRLAKEAFEKEKKEFEEKQAEAKFQERKKFLVDEDYWRIYFISECGEQDVFAKNKLLNYTDSEFEDLKQAVLKAKEPAFKDSKPEQSAKEDYHEADVDPKGLSTRLKANTPMSEKELTWDDIWLSFIDEVFDINSTSHDFSVWLANNYNVPTRKI